MRSLAVAARKSICGLRLITFSGQVALHSPHCTQASSAKRSIGCSGSSASAPVGQAETQDRHSVQPSTLTSTAPNGAPSGSATISTGAGAAAVQLAQGQPHHVALAADGGESGGLGRAVHRRDGVQSLRPARPDRRSRSLRRARRQSRGRRGSAGQRDGLGEAGQIVARLGAHEKAHRRCAVGKAAATASSPTCVTSLTCTGNTFAGNPSPWRANASINSPPCSPSWNITTGLLAARFAVGAEQRAQLAQQRVGRRQSIGRGAGRAGGGALAAAGANCASIAHMIAVGRDRAGRTEIEAAAAADDLGARMRAQVLAEIDVARLVEVADEIARLEHGAQDRRRIAGIGAQIAVAQIGGRKQRRAAGQIDQDVAARRAHRCAPGRTAARRARKERARHNRRPSIRRRRDSPWLAGCCP